jgi:hypothetical protein
LSKKLVVQISPEQEEFNFDAPSLAVKELSRAVPCHRGAVALSLTIQEPSRRPSLLRSRCAVHCRRGAVAPYLTVNEVSAMSADDSGHSSRPSKPLVGLVGKYRK